MAICLVLRDPVTDTFVIDITPEMYETKLISHIRGLVYSYNVNSFVGIDEKRIKLWKVTISTSDTSKANKKLEILKSLENSRIEIDIVRDLGGVFLPPGEEIRDHFNKNEKLASGHIHIIVQPPPPATTGKCLPMVYLSNKKFALSHILYFFYSIRQKESGRFGRGK